MKRLFITALLILLPFTLFLSAMPAYREAIIITQPDGSQIEVFRHGDARFHYMTLTDGRWVKKDTDGFIRQVPAMSQEQIARHRQLSPLSVKQENEQAYPLNIAPRGLIILVNFKDAKFKSENDLSSMQDMHNGEDYTYNGATGSARQYFIDQSDGAYKPQFDVVGPVTLDNNYKYYGADSGGEGNDIRAIDMVVEACQKADDQFSIDFSQYDHNDDGDVDFVYVLFAGYGQNDSDDDDTIWPHSFWVHDFHGQKTGGPEVYIDGKRLNTYACSAELNGKGNRNGIGTFCHEFSHVLGLPDLYTTNSSTHKTMGQWDILDYGPYNNNGMTPPSYSAYERFFLGWLQPKIISSSQAITIQPLSESNEAYLFSQTGSHNLQGNSPDPNEFYLIENRQQTGWDSYIPGHGMLLTKINYTFDSWFENTVNNYPNKLGVDIIEADGSAPSLNSRNRRNGYYGKATDAFPAGANTADLFDDMYHLTNIEETNDGTINLRMVTSYERYKVSFVVGENGSCSTTELTESSFGSGIELPQATPTDLLYTFIGWATSIDATVSDAGVAGDIFYPTSDTTLYAIFAKEPVKHIYDFSGREQVLFDVNDLHEGLYIMQTEHGKKKILIIPTATK